MALKHVIYQNETPFGIIQDISPQGNGIYQASRILINENKGNWKEPFIIKTFDGDELLEEMKKPVWIIQYLDSVYTPNIHVIEQLLLSEMR